LKIVNVEEMVQMERLSAEIGLPPDVLMENAGLAAAKHVKKWLGSVAGQHVLILIGPGNNGGDGLVVARHIHDWGAIVHLYIPRPCKDTDDNYRIVRQRGIHTILAEQPESQAELDGVLASATAVVDSFFGTGKTRPIEGAFKQASNMVKEAKQRNGNLQIISVDLPSGLNADTGAVDDACFKADCTITFACPKHGLFAFPGAAHVGKLVVADIGIPRKLAEHITTEMITIEGVRALLPVRPLSANKGTFGRCLVMAGSVNYIGAAYLACAAATRVGAGLVTLATARSLQPVVASRLTEATYLPLPESAPGVVAIDADEVIKPELANYNAMLIGCGIGRSQPVTELVQSVLFSSSDMPSLIIDADALNILAEIPQWWQRVGRDAIVTPHPGEMSRLTGSPVQEVQSRRLEVAKEMAASWNKTVVLKGAYTVVAAPDGRAMVNPIANAGLASAGTGDVLAGAIAGIAAQGISLFDAAVTGVFLHSQAGEMVKEELGDTGMVASDLLPVLPGVIGGIRKGYQYFI